jgi:hypothetical protein
MGWGREIGRFSGGRNRESAASVREAAGQTALPSASSSGDRVSSSTKESTGEKPKLAVRNKLRVDDNLYATVPTFDAS